MLALGASLELLIELGSRHVAASMLDITDRACERLGEIGATIVSDRRPDHRGGEQRSGIVAFELPGRDPLAVKKHCPASKTSCSAAAPADCESARMRTTMKRTLRSVD